MYIRLCLNELNISLRDLTYVLNHHFMKRGPPARRTFDLEPKCLKILTIPHSGIHPYIKTSPPYILST